MDAFGALAEPRRRQVVTLLAQRATLSASEISAEFDLTPQAISQHLRVLREANIIPMEKRAQQRLYALNPESMDQIPGWAGQMARLWIGRRNRLDRALREEAR